VPAPDAPSLVVLDKMTGRLVATDKEHIGPQIIHCTWSSPSVGMVGGRSLVFFAGGDAFCYGFEVPESEGPGAAAPTTKTLALKRVWRFDCDPSAPKKDVHKYQDDRYEGPSHISGMPVFHQGRVYITVGGDIWHGKREAWLKCIDATKTGDLGAAGELWSNALERHCVSTPSINDGLVYVADCGRYVHCVDVDTGKPYWKHQTDGEIWCSTLVADGKVYVGTRRGRFWVLAAGKEKKVLSKTDLGDPIHGSPVAANGVLYVATMSRLYAFQQDAAASPLSPKQ
jgi:outer membrane protein assembly factor BamB